MKSSKVKSKFHGDGTSYWVTHTDGQIQILEQWCSDDLDKHWFDVKVNGKLLFTSTMQHGYSDSRPVDVSSFKFAKFGTIARFCLNSVTEI